MRQKEPRKREIEAQRKKRGKCREKHRETGIRWQAERQADRRRER